MSTFGHWSPVIPLGVRPSLMDALFYDAVNATRRDSESESESGPTSLFVQVGGTIGTLAIAAVESGLDVLMFETLPDSLDLIRSSVARNGLDSRITVRDVPLGGPADISTVCLWQIPPPKQFRLNRALYNDPEITRWTLTAEEEAQVRSCTV